jgi:hypothetical protein
MPQLCGLDYVVMIVVESHDNARSNKTMHSYGAILTATDDPLVAEAYARHWAGVTCQRAFVLACPWIPDLDRLVLGAADQA